MSSSPKEVLERFYKAEEKYMNSQSSENGADFSEIRETLSPDVVLHQTPDLPYGGDYHGHEGYEKWAAAMSSTFDKLDVSERQFYEKDDTVVVTCQFRTRSRRNGSTQDYPMVHIVKVQEGKVVDFRPFYWNVPAYSKAAEA